MKASTNGCSRQQDSEEWEKCLKCAQHLRHAGAVSFSSLFAYHPCLLVLSFSLSL
jgi:hypothetical protein